MCLDFQLASRNYESYLINAFNEYLDEDKIEECQQNTLEKELKSSKGTLLFKIIDNTKKDTLQKKYNINR